MTTGRQFCATINKEAGEEDFQRAARALHNFLDARAQGAWAAACRYLASDIVDSLAQLAGRAEAGEAPGCATLLREITNPAALPELRREAKVTDIGSLRTDGEQSFAIYRGLEGTIMAIPMARESGRWKVASLAGLPLS